MEGQQFVCGLVDCYRFGEVVRLVGCLMVVVWCMVEQKNFLFFDFSCVMVHFCVCFLVFSVIQILYYS